MKTKLDIREANKEYFELNEPQYYTGMNKWYVSIKYDEHFYLHSDVTIKLGTFVENVPGEKIFSGFYDTKRLAEKAVKIYNQRWIVEQNNLDVDAELLKEFERLKT